MGGILNLIFSKKIETYMPFFFLGVSFNKCKEVTGERRIFTVSYRAEAR